MKCAFCEIPKIKDRKIIENELAWAFPTNIPITKGHTLIVPKRCVAKFDDLNNNEIKAIFDLANKIKKALTKTYNTQGFNIAWNENEVAGQNIPHFHLHIVPRKENDKGIYEYEPRKFLYRTGSRESSPESELKIVALEIQQNL